MACVSAGVCRFNDLHLFDFQTESWQAIEFPATAMIPCPRSGHQVCICVRARVLGGIVEEWSSWFVVAPRLSCPPWVMLLLQMIQLSGTNDVLMYGGYSEVKVPGRPSKCVRACAVSSPSTLTLLHLRLCDCSGVEFH